MKPTKEDIEKLKEQKKKLIEGKKPIDK